MSQSYIKWNKFSDDNIDPMLISGKQYLVCTGEDRMVKVVEIQIGTWYNKGDKVRVPAEITDEEKKMTVEQRLWAAINGTFREKDVEIKEDGFYYMTDDKEVIETLNFSGCLSAPVKISLVSDNVEDEYDKANPELFWAELPIAPEGYIYEHDYEEAFEEVLDDMNARNKDEVREYYNTIVDCSEELTGYYNAIKKRVNEQKNKKTGLYRCSGLEFKIDDMAIKKTIALICSIADVGEAIMRKFTPNKLRKMLEKSGGIIIECTDEGDYYKFMDGEARLPDNSMAKTFISIYYVYAYSGKNPHYFNWFFNICSRINTFKDMDKLEIAMYARFMYAISDRIDRFIKQRREGVMDILLQDLMCIIFDMGGYALFNAYEKKAPDFEDYFRIKLDGPETSEQTNGNKAGNINS